MKQSQFFLLSLLLLQSTHITTIDNNQKKEKQLSLYNAYFIIKELCNTQLYSYWIDHNKIDQAKITCHQCHSTMVCTILWGYCASAMDQARINKLMPLIYYGSAEKLAEFLLTSVQELKMPCPGCGKYDNWYILTPTTPMNEIDIKRKTEMNIK